MTKLLRNKVGEYVTNNANVQSWESVRAFYGAYTYITFLCLAVSEYEDAHTWQEVHGIAEGYGLETQAVLDSIATIDGAEELANDILEIISEQPQYDIEDLYQDYLSVDFMIKSNAIVFDEGKNSRDVLGSYYTQDEFAETITRKAFKDYFKNNLGAKTIRIVDYSCGGAIFLKAALKICCDMDVRCEVYGYDVDPIAVLISRVKTWSFIGKGNVKVRIMLGNPLLPKAGSCIEKFKKSLLGRYYNSCMGIDPIDEVDIVLGNPPWEKVRFEEKKFLHHFFPNAEVGTKFQRERLLTNVLSENADYYKSVLTDYVDAKKTFKKARIFEKSSCGEINTYALFTELSERMLKRKGVAALIIKSSLVKMPVYKGFFSYLLNEGILYDIYMFTNRNKIFNIDSREEFSVVYMSNGMNNTIDVALNLDNYEDFEHCNKITITGDELSLLNPETAMIPNIKNPDDLRFLLRMAQKNNPFGEIYYGCRFGRLVHLTNHSNVIKKQRNEGYLPIYEGKFIELYTGKYASFSGMTDDEKYKNKAPARQIENPQGCEYPEARFYIESNAWKNMSKNFSEKYIVAWRSLTSATNRRTMLATILPLIPTCQSIQMLQLEDERQMLHLIALFNSIVFDYIVRLKMVGLDLTQTILKQIPVPSVEAYDNSISFNGVNESFSVHILSRLKELYKDDSRIVDVFSKYDLYKVYGSRKKIIAEIDKLIGKLYGLNDNVMVNIAKSFDSYYSEEEIAAYFG